MKVYGRVHSYETFGAVDGPGIRFVVFLQGCPLKCVYCHNPDSRQEDGGEFFEAEEVFEKIKRYKNFIKDGGVTLSGGEPLKQPEFVARILSLCKSQRIHTAIDTSGGIPLEISKQAIDQADLILLDIKGFSAQDYKDITDCERLHATQLLEYCNKRGTPVWLRYVLVPHLTLKDEKLIKLAEIAKSYGVVERVELLPFHKHGEYKYDQMGLKYRLKNTREPSNEEIEKAKAILENRGVSVYV